MKKFICMPVAVFLFYATNAQNSGNVSNGNFQLSLLNGYNNFLDRSGKDSTFFLKGGLNTGIQGNYFWKSFGLGGRLGYFSNSVNKNALSQFGETRKASPDRSFITSKPFTGVYFLAGPSFRSTFKRLNVESNLLGGWINGASSGFVLRDKAAQDIIYYKNNFDESAAFTWCAGLGVNYALTQKLHVGVTADYQSLKKDIVNFDMLRGNGREARNSTEQAEFLNTALKLTYNLSGSNNTTKRSIAKNKNGNATDADLQTGNLSSTSNTPGKQSNNDCNDKVMDVAYLEPKAIDVSFNSLQEAQDFLKTCGNPMYQSATLSNNNPVYQGNNKIAIKEQGVKSSIAPRDAASGLASGKRTHKPVIANYDEYSNTFELNGKYYIQTAREAGSGMASGKRNYNNSPADSETNANKNEFAIKEQGVKQSVAGGLVPGGNVLSSGLSQPRGMIMQTAKGEHVFALFPADIDLLSLSQLDGGAITINIKNGNAESNNKATINTTRSNIKSLHQENENAAVPKAQNNGTSRSNRTDNPINNNSGNNEDSEENANKAGISTSRSNIRTRAATGVVDGDGVAQATVNTTRSNIKQTNYIDTDSDDDGIIDITLFTDGNGNTSTRISRNVLKSFFEKGDAPAGHQINAPRDVATGQSSGKRQHKPITVNCDDSYEMFEFENRYYANIKSPRDAATGQASGKRQHKPMVAYFDELTNTFEIDRHYFVEIKSPRDVASGQASGKRQHKPLSIKYYSDLEIIEYENEFYSNVKSPRDAASGMASGKRQHKPMMANFDELTNTFELDGNYFAQVKSPRDAASGQASGKRQHKPLPIKYYEDVEMIEYENEFYSNVKSPRDAASGIASGKRQHKPMMANYSELTNTFELEGKYFAEVIAPRDAASGLPTGKRQHKPFNVFYDADNDEIESNGIIYYEIKTARDAGSGMATGRRVLPTVNKRTLPIRIVCGDENTAKAIVKNNTTRGGSVTMNSQTSSTRTTQNTSFGSMVRSSSPGDPIPGLDVKMIKTSGNTYPATTNENGFIEAENDFGDGEYQIQLFSNGKWNNILVAVKTSCCADLDGDGSADKMLVEADTNGDGSFEAIINTSRSNIKNRVASGDVNGDGVTNKITKSRSNIQNNRMASGDVDETEPGNTTARAVKTRSNIQNNRMASDVSGNDYDDDGSDQEKSHVIPHVLETSGRYIIKMDNGNPARGADGSCKVNGEVIMNGIAYPAVITMVLKTRHDTVKNSIGNIR